MNQHRLGKTMIKKSCLTLVNTCCFGAELRLHDLEIVVLCKKAPGKSLLKNCNCGCHSEKSKLLDFGSFLYSIFSLFSICTSYRTVPRAIWYIFYEFLLLSYLLCFYDYSYFMICYHSLDKTFECYVINFIHEKLVLYIAKLN